MSGADLLVRLGGGRPVDTAAITPRSRDRDGIPPPDGGGPRADTLPHGIGTATLDGHERSGYLVTGLGVVFLALAGAAVTACALTAAGGIHPAFVTGAALAAASLTATLGRALATRRPGRTPDRFGNLTRLAVAVATGALLGELAATVVLGGVVDRRLDDQARLDAADASAVIDADARASSARADREAAATGVDTARADVEGALVVARCEYNPTPGCPLTHITGVPGHGPESRTAEALLADARTRLDTAQTRLTEADRRVTDADLAAATAETGARTSAERGLGARWLAMHSEALASDRVALLRALTVAPAVLLALLPLVLRWWRGETSQDRRAAYRLVTQRAALDADTAIALERARLRTTAEILRAGQDLAATATAAPEQVADREPPRLRVVAAVGGLELEMTGPARPIAAGGDGRPAADTPVTVDADPLPALDAPDPIVATPAVQSPALPVAGWLPFADTAARIIGPFVPDIVTRAVDDALTQATRTVDSALGRAVGTATAPLRTVRQVLRDAEEITVTLRRARSPEGPRDQGASLPWSGERVTTVVETSDPEVTTVPPTGLGADRPHATVARELPAPR